MAQEHHLQQPRNNNRKPRNQTDLLIQPNDTTTKKNHHYFKTCRFKGLGCSAPAQVSVPTMIRSSANWKEEDGNKKVIKKKGKKNIEDGIGCLVVPDVWCGPGNGLGTDAASVENYVVSSSSSSRRGSNGIVSRGTRLDVLDKVHVRERGSCGGRRMVHPEEVPFFDNDSRIPHHRLDVFGSRQHRHLRHRSPHGLAEIVLLQGNLLLGGRSDSDRYREWRLDVESMSYEDLLELGDKIGYVCTGLKEDEIGLCVRKTKLPVVSEDKSSTRFPTEMQRKCTICQMEYEEDDETGKLDCGHFYHMYCIKQWLVQKKSCPICKVEVESQKQAG